MPAVWMPPSSEPRAFSHSTAEFVRPGLDLLIREWRHGPLGDGSCRLGDIISCDGELAMLVPRASTSPDDPPALVNHNGADLAFVDHDVYLATAEERDAFGLAATPEVAARRSILDKVEENRICTMAGSVEVAGLDLPLRRVSKATHGGNATVEPALWGLTVGQVLLFIQACGRTAKYQQMKRQSNQFKSAGHVNAYELDAAFVRPWSAGTGNIFTCVYVHRAPTVFVAGCSVSLLLNNSQPLHASTMISHAWGENMEELVEVLLERICLRELPGDTVVWFCVLVNPI